MNVTIRTLLDAAGVEEPIYSNICREVDALEDQAYENGRDRGLEEKK